MTEVAEIRKMADRRLGDTLMRADTALSTVEALRVDLKPVLGPFRRHRAQVNASLSLFFSTATTTSIASSTATLERPGESSAPLEFRPDDPGPAQRAPKMLLTWQQIGTDVSGTPAI